ncbi:hypothetical protein BDW75DRAFT_245649 [Aspergillus navahoensis]
MSPHPPTPPATLLDPTPRDKPVENPPVPTRRGRYVARACLYCQRRKIRCSGAHPCQHCRSPDDCTYPERGRKPRARPSPAEAAASTSTSSDANAAGEPQQQAPTADGSEEDRGHDGRVQEILSRVTRLEENVTSITTDQAAWAEQLFLTPTTLDYRRPFLPPFDAHPAPFPALNLGATNDPEPATDQEHRRGPSLAKSIGAIDQPPELASGEAPVPYPQCLQSVSSGKSPRGDDAAFSACCEKDLVLWSVHSRATRVASLRGYFRSFFDGPNMHYPCVNEPFFQSWFETLMYTGGSMPRNPESMQFVALIHLMVAVVKILGDNAVEGPAGVECPGWADFARAEHLLGHVLWAGSVSHLSIQCLITKASYLLYVEKAHLAYDAVGTATRIMYQLGLHDQRLWKEYSDFQTTMCQRIFWSLYCLDRAIALASGAPCIIQDATIRVNLPLPLDDRQLLPGAVLPSPSPTSSSVPYLQEMVSWARLYSDTCKMVSDDATTRLLTPEVVDSLDQKILNWLSGLPAHLTWSADLLILNQTNSLPHFILRHSVILLLRGNYLRLLIRQEEVIHRSYQPEAAAACVNIATHSIDVVHLLHYSFLHRPTERYSSVTFLAGAMIPLICVLLRERPGSELFTSAVEPFRKALSIMQGLAPAFAYARHILARFRSNVVLAEKRIEKEEADRQKSTSKQPASRRPEGLELTRADEADFSQPLEDILRSHMMPEQFTMENTGINETM